MIVNQRIMPSSRKRSVLLRLGGTTIFLLPCVNSTNIASQSLNIEEGVSQESVFATLKILRRFGSNQLSKFKSWLSLSSIQCNYKGRSKLPGKAIELEENRSSGGRAGKCLENSATVKDELKSENAAQDVAWVKKPESKHLMVGVKRKIFYKEPVDGKEKLRASGEELASNNSGEKGKFENPTDEMVKVVAADLVGKKIKVPVKHLVGDWELLWVKKGCEKRKCRVPSRLCVSVVEMNNRRRLRFCSKLAGKSIVEFPLEKNNWSDLVSILNDSVGVTSNKVLLSPSFKEQDSLRQLLDFKEFSKWSWIQLNQHEMTIGRNGVIASWRKIPKFKKIF